MRSHAVTLVQPETWAPDPRAPVASALLIRVCSLGQATAGMGSMDHPYHCS